jgi:hypothetical protein
MVNLALCLERAPFLGYINISADTASPPVTVAVNEHSDRINAVCSYLRSEQTNSKGNRKSSSYTKGVIKFQKRRNVPDSYGLL